MDYNLAKYITLNKQLYSKDEIQNLMLSEKNHFAEVIQFLKEWFSETTEISVQTSGSTGKPKQILIPKQSFVESAKNTCDFLNLNKKTNALLCIPIKYIGGKMMVIRALVSGYNLWIDEPSSSPLKKINKTIDFLSITPMQAQNCLKDSAEKLIKINQIIIGGGAISDSFVSEIKEHNNQFYSTYGMTETVSHIALKKLNGANKSDSFEVLPSYSVSVNKENCLVIDCPSLFPESIVTNDIVELTKTGFKWLGRKDNVINSGGIKISPEDIEAKIKMKYPDLVFYISSKKDKLLGERIVLVTEKSIELNIETLQLEKYQVPKEIIISKVVFTETGKIKREKF
jgi:o-succinylbenzoate---CoA ligase